MSELLESDPMLISSSTFSSIPDWEHGALKIDKGVEIKCRHGGEVVIQVQSLATQKMTQSVTWPSPHLILLGSEEDTVVLVLEHGARILTVGRRHILLLVDQTEPHLLNDSPHRAVGGLNAVLAPLV